jgi:hypothetical protein
MSRLISTASLLYGLVTFKELELCQYRQLLKCFLGDDVFPELIFNNTDLIIKELTDLTQDQIDNLSFIDYCLLLFNIRQGSIGDTVFLYVEDNEQKQLKIDLRTSRINELLLSQDLIKLLEPEVIDICEIKYRIPSIKEVSLLEKNKDDFSVYTFFLKTIKFSDVVINLENYTYIERENIIKKIPVRALTALTKRTHMIIDVCNNFNILQSVNNEMFDKKLILTLNSQIIALVIKLLYNSSLESIYEYMFALSKAANISCNFLDKCSPGEFYFFVKKLEEINARQQQDPASDTAHNSLPPISSEFGLE